MRRIVHGDLAHVHHHDSAPMRLHAVSPPAHAVQDLAQCASGYYFDRPPGLTDQLHAPHHFGAPARREQ